LNLYTVRIKNYKEDFKMIIVPFSVILCLFLGGIVVGVVGNVFLSIKEKKDRERFVIKKYGLKKTTKAGKIMLILLIPLLFFFSIVGGLIMVLIPALEGAVSVVIVLTLNGIIFYNIISYLMYRRKVKKLVKQEFGDSRVS
jgi:hypothetical protein